MPRKNKSSWPLRGLTTGEPGGGTRGEVSRSAGDVAGQRRYSIALLTLDAQGVLGRLYVDWEASFRGHSTPDLPYTKTIC